MKISVPWPYFKDRQPRIREALSHWEQKEDLIICCPTDDLYEEFFEAFGSYRFMPRNSTDVGCKVPKCFIKDMMEATLSFPNEDWYGFGNSDCVPHGDLLENVADKEVLIYHRTDINEWSHRHDPPKPDQLKEWVWKSRQRGVSDKKIARQLNRDEVPPLRGPEWHYKMVEELCQEQGTVFVLGQDLYLFRADVVHAAIDEYLKVHDPILGTGAFDPRLTRWCMKRFNSCRILHKLYHKRHESEWEPGDDDHLHNGGKMTAETWPEFIEEEFLLSLSRQGYVGAIPAWFMQALKKKNFTMWKSLIA